MVSNHALKTITELVADLASGAVTARQLVDDAIERIEDPAGEGSRAFLRVDADQARATADGYDADRAAGRPVPPFAGLPFAVKDLCDVEGQVSAAGSVVLSGEPAAASHAPVLQRVVDAGFIPIGRTNMTEFAYSGLGLNSHFPAPASPWDREERRIPGGSSSGTGVAVADGMAVAGLGTDTGGSCRIPAAFNNVVGYKPTARRVPLDGIVPLSLSLDSVGPLARSVTCCAIVDDLFAGGDGTDVPAAKPATEVRIGALSDVVFDGIDADILSSYQAALGRLRAAGVQVEDAPFPELAELGNINAKGGLAVAEAYHWHRHLLATGADRYDQRVRNRIEPGADMSAAEYLDVLMARQVMIAIAAQRMDGFDCFVLPAVVVAPPTFASFEAGSDDENAEYYGDMNRLCLRNTSIGNFLDSCSISIPARPGLVVSGSEPPVGVMLMGAPMDDKNLLAVARAVEAALAAT